MILQKPQSTRRDTRGLPEGFDPHKFYEYKINILSAQAEGAEALLYRLLPFNLIRSFAIAIDPFYKLRVSSGTITPVNRKISRQKSLGYRQLTVHNFSSVRKKASAINWLNIPGCVGPILTVPSPPDESYTSFGAYQDPIGEFRYDTTYRTRLLGSKTGEFEKFNFTLLSPQRTSTYYYRDEAFYDTSSYEYPSYPNRIETSTRSVVRTLPTSASLSPSVVQQLSSQEKEYASALMAEHALSLYKSVNPMSRGYSLVRNIVELRDVPSSVLSLRESFLSFRNLYRRLSSPDTIGLRNRIFDLQSIGRTVSNEYLSYQFGWRQLYSDIQGLLTYPEKAARQIEFLLTRRGKPTTYRSKRVIPSAISGVSGFSYQIVDTDADPRVTESRLERLSEVRCVYNATLDFPPPLIPSFRRDLFFRKIGLAPDPIDLYNLVPWTWLYDWFTGLGNYLELIETINQDPSIVNYGFITVDIRGKLITQFDWRNKTELAHSDGRPGSVSYVSSSHQSTLEYRYNIRRDMSSVFDVASVSSGKGLTPYQQSILGALMLQRTKYSPKNIRF